MRTLKRSPKGPELVIELQRVPSTQWKHGSYRVAVLKFRSIQVGTIYKSMLLEIDSFDNIRRLQDAEKVYNWALTGKALRLVG